MYDTIVFDLDGTLLDTLDDLTDAVNFALSYVGAPNRTREEVRAFVGNGIANLTLRALGEEHKDKFDIAFETFKKHYKEHCQDKTAPYEGVLELLRVLKGLGVKTAVLSNKADFATKLLVEKYFSGYIDQTMGENEAMGIRKKPAPDALFTIMENLGATRGKTVYVGDSDVDILTANNAGIDCISCTWGFRDKQFLLQSGAKIIVSDPMEIVAFCEG